MKKKKKIKSFSNKSVNINYFIADSTLDYHDLGILDSYDIEKHLSDFILESYHKGFYNILIITGKGKVVKPRVEKLLKINKMIKKFNIASFGNGDTGAYEVILNA